MRFFISGELDSEIAESFLVVRRDVEKRLNEGLAAVSYGDCVEEIFLAPIILGPRFNDRVERKLIKHKSKIADYRLVIDYESFLNGSEQARQQRLLNHVLAAISDISRKLHGGLEGGRLVQDILEIFKTERFLGLVKWYPGMR